MLGQYVVIKAIQKLASEPNTAFSVRGLAASTEISKSAAGTALELMKNKGIASLQVIGKTYQYKANLESALCRQWKILFNLDLIQEARIVGKIIEKNPRVYCILLYGSFAKGTNDEKSDIDLLVIAQKLCKSIEINARAGRELNITIMELKEWRKKAVEDKVFYENVIYDSIALHGEKPVVL